MEPIGFLGLPGSTAESFPLDVERNEQRRTEGGETGIFADLPNVTRTEGGQVIGYDELMPLADTYLASDDPDDHARGIELRRRMGFRKDSHLGDGK